MIEETTYNLGDLHKAKCRTCNTRTMVTDDGKCPECIEADKFYEMITGENWCPGCGKLNTEGYWHECKDEED